MSGGPEARLSASVKELRALVVELVEANAGLRAVIRGQRSIDRRSGAVDRVVGAVAGRGLLDVEPAAVVEFAISQARSLDT